MEYLAHSNYSNQNLAYGPHSKMQESREAILRITAFHKNDKALLLLAREFAPAALATVLFFTLVTMYRLLEFMETQQEDLILLQSSSSFHV